MRSIERSAFRASRIALATTTMELADIPSAAAHGGTIPVAASGTETKL
jgi:hypothetical protein